MLVWLLDQLPWSAENKLKSFRSDKLRSKWLMLIMGLITFELLTNKNEFVIYSLMSSQTRKTVSAFHKSRSVIQTWEWVYDDRIIHFCWTNTFLEMKVMCIPIRDEFCFFQESSEVGFGCDVFVLYVIFKFPLFLLEGEKKKNVSKRWCQGKKCNTTTKQFNSLYHCWRTWCSVGHLWWSSSPLSMWWLRWSMIK